MKTIVISLILFTSTCVFAQSVVIDTLNPLKELYALKNKYKYKKGKRYELWLQWTEFEIWAYENGPILCCWNPTEKENNCRPTPLVAITEENFEKYLKREQ